MRGGGTERVARLLAAEMARGDDAARPAGDGGSEVPGGGVHGDGGTGHTADDATDDETWIPAGVTAPDDEAVEVP